MMIMILSYSVSLYGRVFFSLRSDLYQAQNVTILGLSAPAPRWGTSVPQTSCQCLSQTKIIDPPLI